MTPAFVCASISIALASASVILSVRTASSLRRTKQEGSCEAKAETAEPAGKCRSSIGTMNLILILVGVALLVFTISMIDLFKQAYAIPDTLVTCVFATLGGECGILGWIKTNKDKHQQRRWDKEDRRQQTRSPPAGDEDEQPKG